MITKIVKAVSRNIIFFIKGKHLSFFDKIRLKLAPRYMQGEVRLNGQLIKYSDAPSFVSMYEEIFIRKIYKFNSETNTPVIIDGGANIGLGIIYFKLLYPAAIVTAFEPDPFIFDLLTDNIASFSFNNVHLRKEALWIHDEFITFASQGGLSGQIATDASGSNISKVKAFRLKNLLQQKISLLKIDIEGAEYEVIKDCGEDLSNATMLFVEYHSNKNEKQKLSEILSTLSAAGFRYYIQEAFTSPQPFHKVRTMLNMDLQLNIFCIK